VRVSRRCSCWQALSSSSSSSSRSRQGQCSPRAGKSSSNN
jgi:hypothetical protein